MFGPPRVGTSTTITDMLALAHGAGTVSAGLASGLRQGIGAADQLRNDLVGGNLEITYSNLTESQGYWQSGPLPNGNYGYNHAGAADPAVPIYGHADASATPSFSADSWPGYEPAAVAPKITFRSVLPLVPAGAPSRFSALPRSFLMEERADGCWILFDPSDGGANRGVGADRHLGVSPDATLVAQRLLGRHSRLWERDRNATCASSVEVRSLLVRLNMSSDLREKCLRLLDGIRSNLRLTLIRVLSALSRSPDTINAVLVLLAASRCYGHRTEPSGHTLPVLTSMSVVIGEAARLC